jgi:hypothetical protein
MKKYKVKKEKIVIQPLLTWKSESYVTYMAKWGSEERAKCQRRRPAFENPTISLAKTSVLPTLVSR